MIKFIIPLNPITKKNSQQIYFNRANSKPFITSSKIYKEYSNKCGYFLPKIEKPINYPVNIKAIYYRQSKRRVDLTNLESALLDVLVEHNILADDNCKIVVSTDGSRVRVDKDNPRTEVIITKVEEITGFEV